MLLFPLLYYQLDEYIELEHECQVKVFEVYKGGKKLVFLHELLKLVHLFYTILSILRNCKRMTAEMVICLIEKNLITYKLVISVISLAIKFGFLVFLPTPRLR
jgi:hypothetical protein